MYRVLLQCRSVHLTATVSTSRSHYVLPGDEIEAVFIRRKMGVSSATGSKEMRTGWWPRWTVTCHFWCLMFKEPLGYQVFDCSDWSRKSSKKKVVFRLSRIRWFGAHKFCWRKTSSSAPSNRQARTAHTPCKSICRRIQHLQLTKIHRASAQLIDLLLCFCVLFFPHRHPRTPPEEWARRLALSPTSRLFFDLRLYYIS